jgi:transposase
MPPNFIEGRCEQGFLLPPDVRDWLPSDHLAWFVIDAVRGMDLAAFYSAYRADGHGRAAYEPSMMVTLLMHAYATKQRSSRAIEGHCRQDVAYRVITGNLVPDHATIARFVVRHEHALAELFGEVLRLCGEAGLVKPEVIAIDGTRMAGNANSDATRDFGQLAREIVAEHAATDEAEDELYGDARGDELPEQLRTPEGRREFFARAREKLRAAAAEGVSEPEAEEPVEPEFDLMRSGSWRARRAGRAGCGKPVGSSSSIVGRTRSGSRASGSSACCWRPSGWRSTWPRSAVGMRRMSSSRSAAALPAGVGLAARRSRTRHPMRRLGR